MVPKTAWLQTFFRISSFVFRSNTFIQVWNDLRMSNWWQNFHFWVNYPFKVLFWTPLTFHSMYGQKQLKHSSKHFIKICVYVLMHFWLNIHLEVINFHWTVNKYFKRKENCFICCWRIIIMHLNSILALAKLDRFQHGHVAWYETAKT